MRFKAMIAAMLALGLVPPLALGRSAETPKGQTDPMQCRSASASIDRNFPTGAFARCTVSGKNRFQLTIAPEDPGDINCSPWYAFRLTSKRKQRVTVQLGYAACGHRYWPKISSDGTNWIPLSREQVEVSGEGRDRIARLVIKTSGKPVFVASQEILPPSAYAAWLDQISARPVVQRWQLGTSAKGHPIAAISIAAADTKPRETIVLVGRQHPPEVSGALAMLPFVETLLGDDDLAQRFRARFQTIVVPLLNPDGVVGGHWRHNSGGVDLNRDWGPFTQPETRLMQTLLQDIADDPDRQLRLLIDFHSTNRDIFYTIPDALPTNPAFFTRDWLGRLQQRMPDYEVRRDATHVVGRPISKAYVYDNYGVPGVTFELGDDTDRALVRRIGREAALAMMETLLQSPAP